MKPIPIPSFLHDVFGEEQSFAELLIIVAFGVGATSVAVWAYPEIFDLPLWRSILALLLILDIAAGCVANFTRGTNDFYAARPKNRWVFIAIHFHVVVIGWLLGVGMEPALWITGYTLVSAAAVNLMKGRDIQTLLGGLLMSAGVFALLLIPAAPPLLAAVGALFMIKVIFSFAVDHHSGRQT